MATATLMINDLPLSQDLDHKALCSIFGRGREGYEYLGTSYSQTGYQYVGVKWTFLQSNVWFNGKWTSKWRSAYEYRNVQTKVDYFNEWWT